MNKTLKFALCNQAARRIHKYISILSCILVQVVCPQPARFKPDKTVFSKSSDSLGINQMCLQHNSSLGGNVYADYDAQPAGAQESQDLGPYAVKQTNSDLCGYSTVGASKHTELATQPRG
jgi:hypothetical protein